jgi:glycine betaine catabolism A
MRTPQASPAPLEPAPLRAVLDRALTLPAAAYTDPAVFAWEAEQFFARSWVCAGRAADLPRPGDQAAVAAGGETVLLVRDEQGTLRGFFNVCRHRGHELLERGERSARHGWVFINPSGDAGPLAEHLAGLDQQVGPYRPAALAVGARRGYTVAANWKLLVENYHECYHCPNIHPELCRVSPPDSGENLDPAGPWAGGWMVLAQHAVTMSLDGRSGGSPLPGLDPARRRRVLYLGVFPNLLLSLHPDYVMTHRLEPLGPDRTLVECCWLFPAAAVTAGGFDRGWAVAFWDLTNRQDWRACESVQRGVASRGWRQGPLVAREDAVHAFLRLVAGGYLAGGPPSAPAACGQDG